MPTRSTAVRIELAVGNAVDPMSGKEPSAAERMLGDFARVDA